MKELVMFFNIISIDFFAMELARISVVCLIMSISIRIECFILFKVLFAFYSPPFPV
jgi:hypothetical protein